MPAAAVQARRVLVRSVRAPRACWAEKFSEPTCSASRSWSLTPASSRWPIVTGRSSGVMTRCCTRMVSRCSRLSMAGSRNGKATRWMKRMAATAPSAIQGVEPETSPFWMMASTRMPMVITLPMVAAALKTAPNMMAATPPRSARQAIRTRAGTGLRAKPARTPRGRGASIGGSFGEEALRSCRFRQYATVTRKKAGRRTSRSSAPDRRRCYLETAEPVQDVQDRQAVGGTVQRDEADVLANAAAAPAVTAAPAQLSRVGDGLQAEHLGAGVELEHWWIPFRTCDEFARRPER